MEYTKAILPLSEIAAVAEMGAEAAITYLELVRRLAYGDVGYDELEGVLKAHGVNPDHIAEYVEAVVDLLDGYEIEEVE